MPTTTDPLGDEIAQAPQPTDAQAPQPAAAQVPQPAAVQAPPPAAAKAAPAGSSTTPTTSTPSNTATADKSAPIHPFANVKDATYAPPTTRNFGAAPTKVKNRDGSYTNLAPVVQAQIAETVYKRSMTTPTVSLTIEELLSISPDIRNKYREAVTPRRVAHDTNTVSTNMASVESSASGSEQELDCHDNELDPNATIIPDTYETYLRVLPKGVPPSELVVAAESHALRTVDLLIDRKEKVACILDPGSQVICMSEALCYHLGLAFDPTICLSMQSANGGVDRSLGLVHNVPCQVGPITLYLQIHVIRRASYDVLLGRPFDVITESVVKNYFNENQTITLVCPNTNEQVTIPTMPRGRPRFQEVFQKRSSTLSNI
ncbi:hypothetical protein EVJ58_g9269 [Rhodofomes roseus]|uniref:Uncharacterized protein n=1 Tax=Rhodofomes roseus TaxID=34475 RepID=A0A4Y9XWF6_9APHY|nr:hypothetical protein EVJ58_g9269 [Rhodofomes roseus]